MLYFLTFCFQIRSHISPSSLKFLMHSECINLLFQILLLLPQVFLFCSVWHLSSWACSFSSVFPVWLLLKQYSWCLVHFRFWGFFKWGNYNNILEGYISTLLLNSVYRGENVCSAEVGGKEQKTACSGVWLVICRPLLCQAVLAPGICQLCLWTTRGGRKTVSQKSWNGESSFLILEVAHNLMQKGSPEEHSTPYQLPFGSSPCLIKADSQICDLSARDWINAF